jgi:hypothetical protein
LVPLILIKGWTTFLWNALFHHSMMEGDDYFYQLNDDIKMLSAGWTDLFVNQLLKSPVFPNFGMVGPKVFSKFKKGYKQSFYFYSSLLSSYSL